MTFLAIAMALGAGVVLGVPLVWLARGRKPLTEADWLAVPFVGLSAAMLVLHNFVYFDITVRRVTPWIWAGAGLLWAWMLARGAGGERSGVRAALTGLVRSVPWPVY